MNILPACCRKLFSTFGLAMATAAISLTAMSGYVHAATEVPGAGGTDGALQVGMQYVVPPFVGGSKVRTPEAIDTALAEALATRLALAWQAVPAQADSKQALMKADEPRVVLAPASTSVSATADARVAISTGYALAPMAIMRTDTDIKSWEQLKNRSVCLAEGGRYVGSMAARYGAKEMVYRAPADALLALRIGECDAAVHDETMLKSLLKLPEWKKFSAQLVQKDKEPLVFLADAGDEQMVSALRQLTKEWKSSRHLAALTKSRANDIAFEVYLDQTVADCH
ncbi:transporter substrate-binding domain-containing protein [Pollutimonas harenae]|uniref:Transporter substrate-binding domain-containing protein n=1 Tax=Pollutimonas harenae TaxID=657015 RepID=A0A853H4V7_9BURK|nr:transporter substrate-binding domain-containing protein [Pollutimonas harenae]NYT86205.1 transporter substrate-binding domain-containing protein [Pollutimonas harenae]TEA71237.1 transporter substrate-binding domain-containing protein [Pollutimonas harenae]